MSSKPVLFISAVSRELHSARDLVAKTLAFLGYDSDWQDIFGTEQGDLKEMLRRRIDAADGLIQLVGQSYGFEPPQHDAEFGRVSYTQYEALHAQKRGRKVWFILLDDNFPADPHDGLSDELRQLQCAYRQRVHDGKDIWHTATTNTELENRILKLRQDLQELRRKYDERLDRQDATLNKILSTVETLAKRDTAAPPHDEKLLHAFARLPVVLGQMPHDPADPAGNARLAAAYARSESEHGLASGILKEKLPGLTEWLLGHHDLDPLVRAHALFIQRHYDQAERTALRAARQLASQAIEAYMLAGSAAQEQTQCARALTHYLAAAALTSQQRDPIEWARVQHNIAYVLHYQGDYRQAAEALRPVIETHQNVLGPEHPDTLGSRHSLATVLNAQGKHAEALMEHRAVLAICQRVLGPVHPNTLSSRNNLAVALAAQGKHAAAEAENRAVLAIRERVLGPEHPDALASRKNLAVALNAQGKHTEAEVENRARIAIEERVLGPEHPDTLASRSNLATVLAAQGKHAEGEAEHRAVLAIRQRVLGPEHPDTLASRNNLAITLRAQGKHAAAEAEHRARIAIEERVLGPEHPDTLASRNNLATALAAQGKHAEAESEFRAVLDIRQRVLEPEHPEVFASHFNLANSLKAQGKKAEALTFARRALEGWRKTLGEAHPNTKKAKKLVEQLEQAQ